MDDIQQLTDIISTWAKSKKDFTPERMPYLLVSMLFASFEANKFPREKVKTILDDLYGVYLVRKG
jgi:hypothetical protein